MKLSKKTILLIVTIIAIGSSIAFVKFNKPPKPNGQTVLFYDDDTGGLGDTEHQMRLVIAGRNLGWDVYKYSLLKTNRLKIDKRAQNIAVLGGRGEISNQILALSKVPKEVGKYLISWWDSDPNVLEDKSFADLVKHYHNSMNSNVDGHLVTYQKQLIRDIAEIPKSESYDKHDAKFFMTWFPTVYSTPYQELIPRKVMYSGGTWGDRLRQSEKYRNIYQKLSDQGDIQVYGTNPEGVWDFLGESYKGMIPFDGKSFLSVLSENGISLVLHSDIHISSLVPTARVFEGAAASTIMICDDHPFVKREFGDAILYIDHTVDEDAMFKQINDHLTWIKSHPKEVLAKTKKAHDIFMEKFTLEGQLKALKREIEKVSR